MSKDLKLDKICDHKIIEEQVTIDPDLRTIRIPRPLASKNVILFVNNFLFDKESDTNGWLLEEDTSSAYTQKSKIILNYKRKSTTDFYIISYFVRPEFCPKCRGLRILNDPSYNKLGKLNFVENEEKLLQEIKKGISTELESNPFHRWIGTEIHTLIGSKVFDVELLKSRITQEVTKYLEKYLEVQLQQARFQDVTNRESFYNLIAVDVTSDYNMDISYWTVSIIFQNRTGADMLYEKKFKIPDPQNILY